MIYLNINNLECYPRMIRCICMIIALNRLHTNPAKMYLCKIINCIKTYVESANTCIGSINKWSEKIHDVDDNVIRNKRLSWCGSDVEWDKDNFSYIIYWTRVKWRRDIWCWWCSAMVQVIELTWMSGMGVK